MNTELTRFENSILKIIGQKLTHITQYQECEDYSRPFNETDNFDFYIIVTEQEEKKGFFIFPKNVLVKRQILTSKQKEGKRGFRVYPNWTKTENKQAEKKQTWQTNYFINLTNYEQKNIEKLKAIIGL